MKLGILGGGQLARMMVPPAHRLGLEVWVLERNDGCPAKLAGAQQVVGDWADPQAVADFCRSMDVVTLDHEFAPLEALRAAEQHTVLRPGVSTMAKIANKLTQKEALAKAGLTVANSRVCANLAELEKVGQELGWPLVVKTQRGGYDGKGNWLIRELQQAQSLDWSLPLYAEQFVPFCRELAVMVTRNVMGQVQTYPVVETVQENHICTAVKFPAPCNEQVRELALNAAVACAEAVEVVGVLGVEMFETEAGEVMVNELAPRPHNSGHYTLDACLTSQFENHVRAVCGWPLGSTSPTVDGAVMINLLGDGFGSGRPSGLESVLQDPRACLHLYGKTAKPGRKLGHLTVVGEPGEALLERGQELSEMLTFREQESVKA